MKELSLSGQPTAREGARPAPIERSSSAPPAELKGRYEVGAKLGEGGFATTYRGLDRQTGLPCVIKELSLRDVDDFKTIELFEREARVLEHLDHPRIPRFIELFTLRGETETRLYLIQQFIDGRNLSELVRAGQHFTEPEVVEIGLQVARILEYLHDLRPPIIHRDIKPSNIVLGPDNQAYLVDFGAVRDKVLHEVMPEAGGVTVIGTYGYMPFEQFEGRAAPGSDLYSLGVTLLFLLSHKEPHEIETEGSRLAFEHHVHVSRGLATILRRMTAPRLEARYASTSALATDLEAVLEGRMPRRTSPRLVLGLAMLLGAGVAAALLLRPPAPARQATEVTPASRVAASAAASAPALPVQVAGHSVSGRILFDGRPIETLTDYEPKFWFRNEKEGRVQTATVSYQRGRFVLSGLPAGEFGMSVQIDLNEHNPMSYPGDLRSWQTFTVSTGARPELVVELRKIIHLRKPQDNGAAMPHWDEKCEGKLAVPAPVEIAWEPLGEGVVYDYQINRMSCPYTTVGSEAAGSVTATRVSLADLPPSRAGEFYVLELGARKHGRSVGMLITHGASGYGWDFRFRVK